MISIEKLNQEIKAIKLRNERVELNKKWETSWERRILITFLTYGVMVLVMMVIQVNEPWFSAIIPSLGFLLSTMTMEKAKRIWIKRVKDK